MAGSHTLRSEMLLEMTDIVRTFNAGQESELTVLKGCDFRVAPGEFVSVVGQSGSGKSTLMNIIGLLDRPTSGNYLFSGTDTATVEEHRLAQFRAQNIGFIFQNFNLIGRMTALANVEMPMGYARVPKAKRTRRATELLELMGMGDRLHHSPNQLSGGQKQRVAIARALANDPELLLADEPTGALDSHTGRVVMDLFHQLNREMGKTIVFITHNPELAAETTRTVTMVDGNLAASEPNAAAPAHGAAGGRPVGGEAPTVVLPGVASPASGAVVGEAAADEEARA